ncbi:hypothetical protein PLICRDRAFT_150026 [Plicaturopsis crispa FD-325 SS-3]|nr:hypothetical protein PLICRDRAFT_150026 [Plicaturopsis crispa FD-325 SS-3]
MSSISFPHSGSGHMPSPSSSSAHDTAFYAPPFDTNSSFQMNPLSSHPPRTPRTSHVSTNSHTHSLYGNSIYEDKEDTQEHASTADGEEEEDQEEERVKAAEKRVSKEEIWRDILITSNGRDKAFKLMQYSIKLYLLFHLGLSNRVLRKTTRRPWDTELVKRLESTASGLSFTRKLLILFNWLPPLTAIMAQQSVPFSSEQSTEAASKKTVRPLLHALLYAPPPVLLGFVHAIADDVYTFSRLGLIGQRTGDRAGRFSDWCWLLATLVGLVENGVERSMIGNLQRDVESRLYKESMTGATAKSKPTTSKLDEKELGRLHKQDYWLQIGRAKLVMDLIFVSYDLFKIKRGRDIMRTSAGLAAAVLSSAKIYDRQKSALVKALLKF